MNENMDVRGVEPDRSVHPKSFLQKMSDGDYGLARTYWLYGGVVGVGFFIIQSVLSLFPLLYLLFWGVQTFYFIHNLTGVWRASSFYAGPQIWAFLAKVMTVIGWINIPLSLMNVFGTLSNY